MWIIIITTTEWECNKNAISIAAWNIQHSLGEFQPRVHHTIQHEYEKTRTIHRQQYATTAIISDKLSAFHLVGASKNPISLPLSLCRIQTMHNLNWIDVLISLFTFSFQLKFSTGELAHNSKWNIVAFVWNSNGRCFLCGCDDIFNIIHLYTKRGNRILIKDLPFSASTHRIAGHSIYWKLLLLFNWWWDFSTSSDTQNMKK